MAIVAGEVSQEMPALSWPSLTKRTISHWFFLLRNADQARLESPDRLGANTTESAERLHHEHWWLSSHDL
jgi:hypothetical protein